MHQLVDRLGDYPTKFRGNSQLEVELRILASLADVARRTLQFSVDARTGVSASVMSV